MNGLLPLPPLFADDIIVMACRGNGLMELAGVSFETGDLVEYNLTTSNATLVLNNEHVFVQRETIDAVFIATNGRVRLSISGLGQVKSSEGNVQVRENDLFEIGLDDQTNVVFFTNIFANTAPLGGSINTDSSHFTGEDVLQLSIANGTKQMGTNALAVENGDIVEFDVVSSNAVMVIVQEDIWSSPGSPDIKSLTIRDNGNYLLSEGSDNPQLGTNNLQFAQEELAEFDPATSNATIFLSADVWSTAPVQIMGVHDGAFGPEPPNELIPTLSEWGFIILAALFIWIGAQRILQQERLVKSGCRPS